MLVGLIAFNDTFPSRFQKLYLLKRSFILHISISISTSIRIRTFSQLWDQCLAFSLLFLVRSRLKFLRLQCCTYKACSMRTAPSHPARGGVPGAQLPLLYPCGRLVGNWHWGSDIDPMHNDIDDILWSIWVFFTWRGRFLLGGGVRPNISHGSRIRPTGTGPAYNQISQPI